MAHEIHKSTVRDRLPVRREPYWGPPVERGLFVGFRRLQHGGNWIARYRNEDGRQVYHSLGAITGENDYDQAKREAVRWRRSVDAGIESQDVETVADACADYVKTLRRLKREATAGDAEKRFDRIIDRDPLGKVKLSKLRERHLIEWRERMEAGEFPPLPTRRGRNPAPRPMTPTVFKRNLASLKAALNHAVAKRYVSPDKALEWAMIKPDPKADQRRRVYLDKAQRKLLLDSMSTDAMRDFAQCVALTGCRPGDPAAVLRKDYDPRTGTVVFSTKGHHRTIPLSDASKALFDRLAKDKLPKAHLFTQANGQPWTAAAWGAGIKEAVEKAGLPADTVMYTLRHSWITDAIIGGMDTLTVSKLVGTSLAMIEKHYGHLVHEAAREKLQKLAFL
jgi:Site-specific recombinase XerD